MQLGLTVAKKITSAMFSFAKGFIFPKGPESTRFPF
jgi:hypothetical protein